MDEVVAGHTGYVINKLRCTSVRPRSYVTVSNPSVTHIVGPFRDACSDVMEYYTILEKVPMSHEEKYLRPPRDGEAPCANGVDCECNMVSKLHGGGEYVGVVFTSPDGNRYYDMCLLCIRRDVATAVYTNRVSGNRCKHVVQPFMNSVEDGEYSEMVTLQIGTSPGTGVTDSFVYNQTNHYTVGSSGEITQLNMKKTHTDSYSHRLLFPASVDMAQPEPHLPVKLSSEYGSSDLSVLVDEARNNKYLTTDERIILNTYIDRHVFKRIGHSDSINSVYNLPDVVHSVSLTCILDEQHTDIPFVNMLSSALPHRSQFRNFKSLCNRVYSKNKPIRRLLGQVVYLAMSGYFDIDTCGCLSVDDRERLARLVADRATFESWIAMNMFIVYYCVKQFTVYLSSFDTSLYDVLVKYRNWDEYSKFVSTVMSFMVCRWKNNQNVSHTDRAFHRYSLQHVKFVYKPRVQNIYSVILKSMPRNLNVRDQLRSVVLKVRSMGIRTGSVSTELFNRMLATDRAVSFFNNLVEKSTRESQHVLRNELSSSIPSLCKSDLAAGIFVVFLLSEMSYISVSRLPYHWFHNQYCALVKKFQTETLQKSASTVYYCLKCKCLKTTIVDCETKGGSRTKNLYSFGGNRVAYDFDSGGVYCARKKSKNRARSRSGIEDQIHDAIGSDKLTKCIPIDLLGNMIHINNRTYTLCSYCGNVCCFYQYNIRGDRVWCGVCERDPLSSLCGSKLCKICGKDITNSKQVHTIEVFRIDGKSYKIYNEYFCGKHNRVINKVGDKVLLWDNEYLENFLVRTGV